MVHTIEMKMAKATQIMIGHGGHYSALILALFHFVVSSFSVNRPDAVDSDVLF